jgi:hypothetical protein
VLLLLLLQAAGKDFNPIWIFHGSAPENIPKIMEEGFRVGGKHYPKSQHWKVRLLCAARQPSVPRALLLTPAYVVLLLRVVSL